MERMEIDQDDETVQLQCFLCLIKDYDVKKFNAKALDKCINILKARKQHNLQYQDVHLPSNSNDKNIGYHSRPCYSNFTSLKNMYKTANISAVKQQGNGTWRQEAPPPRNTVLHEDQISGDVVDDLYQEEGSLTSLDIKLEHEEVTETEAQDVRALSIRSKHSDEVYCRLCLEQTTKSTYLPLGDIDLNYPDETEEFKNVKQKQIDEVQTMINMCFPFYEPLTFNPVVCSNCISQLKRCYEFTAKVTQNQQLINTYINTSGATENLVNITDIVHSKLNQDVDNSFHRKTDSINTLSQKDTQESAITPIPGQKRVHEHEIESGFASVGKKQKTALHIQDDYDITVKQEPIDPLEHDLDISQNVLDTTDIKVELDYIDTPDLIKTEMEEQFQDTTHLDQSGLSGHSIHPNNTLDKETSFSSPGGTSENLMVHSSKKQRIKK